MARPTKPRRICALPQRLAFAPDGCSPDSGTVSLGIDEYEVVRLTDLEGLTQKQCAAQLQIARSTVSLIQEHAHRKLARAIVCGKRLIISGGKVEVCPNFTQSCCRTCGKGECDTCKKECYNRIYVKKHVQK